MPERLRTNGFEVNIVGDPAMALELNALNEIVRAPEALRIVQAQTVQEIQDWGDTFAAAFDIPAWAGQSWVDATARLGADRAPWKLFVGYLDKSPVATSILFNGGGVASEYGVGTIPRARGQGIGAAITVAPLLQARAQGYRYAVLFATEMGHPVYRRLGFEDVGYSIGRYLWANPEQ
jgi:ribosomal protein S18 acetylase RimI-like enzyme